MIRVALAGLLLAACSPSAMAPAADLAGAPTDFAGLADSYYRPAGTTLTPFLSDAPVRSFSAAGMALTPGRHYFAVVESDAGRMVLELFEDQTPITVNSFVWLALHHYFDGVAFHRVIAGFVAQGGDPNTLDVDRTTWGLGGPGYTFGVEIVPALTYDAAGALGMARTNDPNSNGSQFYLTLAAAHNLDGKYTLFGKVSEGLDVLPKIALGEPPATPTRMTRVYIVDRPR